ncbi:hypothetical protein V8D89_009229 [Ganoderma adspersum]
MLFRRSAPRARLATLADVPEEILERILALVLVQSPEPSRPSWHIYQTPPTTSPGVIAPLLVCRSWLRIATPIHYRHPVLRTPRHVELLLRALRHDPSLAPCVRSLHLHSTSPALRQLVPLCGSLDTLDITVDNADSPPLTIATGVIPAPPVQDGSRDQGVLEFCEAFRKTRSIRHLIIRKNAYLTQPNAIYIFEQLAKAIAHWRKLESVNVAFRMSPSPAASALTKALANAPRLHTLSTMLPTVWNTTLLDIAQNPALKRVVLDPAPELVGAHLFLAEAKRYPRLIELIHAGSPPPSLRHPAHAGIINSVRARAASAAVMSTLPMPISSTVPAWGYERDVPPPTCPPASRRPSQATYAPGSFVGPSAHGYAPAPVAGPSTSYPGSGMQYPSAHQHHREHQQPVVANYPGQYYAYGTPAFHAGPGARLPQPAIVGGQPGARRSTPGGRRMTAA